MLNPIALNPGDIIQIGKGQKQVVVKAYLHISPSWDGDYSVFQIETLPFNAFGETLTASSFGQPFVMEHRTQVNPKSRSYYLEGYSMRGEGKAITMADIKLLGRCKLSTRTEITYGITKVENF